MSNEKSLTDMLMDIALGNVGQVKVITQQLNSQNKVYASELNITDAVPNAELIMELIDRQIGGQKDWC